jgi:hypothetical protein
VPQHLYQPVIQLQGLIQTKSAEVQRLRNLQTQYVSSSFPPPELASVYTPAQWVSGGGAAEAQKVYQQELQLIQEITALQQQLNTMLAPYMPRSYGGGWFGGLGGLGGFGIPGIPQPGGGFPQPGGGIPQPGGGGVLQPGTPSGSAQPPTSPPPAYTPPKPFSTAAPGTYAIVDPGATIRCMFRFTYVWLTNGDQFWYFPIFVGANSIGGFRWNGLTWMYFVIDLRLIDALTCN